MVVQVEALKESHGHEDAGREYYGKDEILHRAAKIRKNAYFCGVIGIKLHIVKKHFTELLAAAFSQREAEQLMRILLEDLFGIDLKSLILNPEMTIDEIQHHDLEQAVDRLLQGEPVQYVTGVAHFDDLILKVNPSVLIPRPETEEIVQKICATSLLCHSRVGRCEGRESIGDGDKHQPIRIWDIGTGSGCIAIALAKHFTDAEVFAFDVSEAALATARENALLNKVKVNFVCDDVLHPQSEIFNEPVDLVVSNPPYVRELEKAGMEHNVLDYEPATALFVPDDDPLRFYRQILRLAKKQLNPGGEVWFEINEAMGKEMLDLCMSEGFAKAEILDDFAGKPRVCRTIFS